MTSTTLTRKNPTTGTIDHFASAGLHRIEWNNNDLHGSANTVEQAAKQVVALLTQDDSLQRKDFQQYQHKLDQKLDFLAKNALGHHVSLALTLDTGRGETGHEREISMIRNRGSESQAFFSRYCDASGALQSREGIQSSLGLQAISDEEYALLQMRYHLFALRNMLHSYTGVGEASSDD